MPAYRSFLFAPGNHARKVMKVFDCGADQVIPQSQGRELFAAALEPKVGYFPPDAHHVDLIEYGGQDQTDVFIAKVWPPQSRQ